MDTDQSKSHIKLQPILGLGFARYTTFVIVLSALLSMVAVAANGGESPKAVFLSVAVLVGTLVPLTAMRFTQNWWQQSRSNRVFVTRANAVLFASSMVAASIGAIAANVLMHDPEEGQLAFVIFFYTVFEFVLSAFAFFGVPAIVALFGRQPSRFISKWSFHNPQLNVEHLLSDAPSVDAAEDLKNLVTEKQSVVIRDLHARARASSRLNSMLLFLVFLVLGFAAYFIAYAGQITGNDAASLSGLDKLSRMSTEQRELMDKLSDRRSGYIQNIEVAKGALAVTTPADPGYLKLSAELAQTSAWLERVDADLAIEKENSVELRRLVSDVRKKAFLETPASSSSDVARLLFATAVTRFGVIAIVIFLVQILVGLYRYNARVSSHYRSQADAILLLDTDAEGLNRLLASLRPHAGFDKTETIPEKIVDKMAEIVRTAVGRSNEP